MPLKIKAETVDGRFSKEISVKTCLQTVTGNYRVVNRIEHQNKRPHLILCSFTKPANDGVVDLLIGIDHCVCGEETLLNSHPLTYQSSDPRDDVPLTPNHFVHCQIAGQFPLILLKPLLFTRVKDGERFRTLFHECGGDGSKNVFLPSTADQSAL